MNWLRTIAPDIVAMKKLLLAILSVLCLLSCSRVEEAKNVVAMAEAMRLGEGKIYSDSTKLAETVNALKPFRWIYPTDYARANYYYGRLLMDSCNNEVEAMRCFINASHTNTKDYHLLYRVYTNMGLLCYYIEDYYGIGFQMFKFAYNQIEHTNNTWSIFSATYNLAWGAAKLKSDETYQYTQQIINYCNDSTIIYHSNLAYAILYLNTKKYKLSLHYADKYFQHYSEEPFVHLIKAQAFSYLGQKDSAVHYAKFVTQNTTNIEKLKNAYYILQYDDADNISKDSVNIISADRMDIQNELDRKHQRLTKAIQLLEQDLNRKPNYPLIIIIAAALTAFIVVTAITAKRIRKKQKRLKHEQLSVEERQKKLERDALIYERQRNEHLNKLKTQLEDTCRAIRETQDLRNTMKWELFDEMCAVADLRLMNIATRLKSFGLNEREVRLCVLVMIDDFSGKEIAQNINYAESGIRSLKSKTAKKIGTDSKNLRHYLISIALFDA